MRRRRVTSLTHHSSITINKLEQTFTSMECFLYFWQVIKSIKEHLRDYNILTYITTLDMRSIKTTP